MMHCRITKSVCRFLAVTLVGCFLVSSFAAAQSKDTLALNKIPRKVMATLKARFPKAEIRKWTKEKEGSIHIYDIEFKQEQRNFEIDIRDDGSIENWEKMLADNEIPTLVRKAAEKQYPKSTIKEAMAITAVSNGKEALEGYEIVLETAGKKEVEITVAPDGKILEDSGKKK